MECPNCGAEIRDGAEHCDLCLVNLTPEGEILRREAPAPAPAIEDAGEQTEPDPPPLAPPVDPEVLLRSSTRRWKMPSPMVALFLIFTVLAIPGIIVSSFVLKNVANNLTNTMAAGIKNKAAGNSPPTTLNPSQLIDTAKQMGVQAKLRAAVATAEQYAAQNDGSYEGLDADYFNSMNPDGKETFVNGDPVAGKFGVSGVSRFTYKISCLEGDTLFSVEVLPSGEIVYTP